MTALTGYGIAMVVLSTVDLVAGEPPRWVKKVTVALGFFWIAVGVLTS